MSGYYAGGHKLKHPYLQQCDPAATIYETIETGGEWASNEDGDGQDDVGHGVDEVGERFAVQVEVQVQASDD